MDVRKIAGLCGVAVAAAGTGFAAQPNIILVNVDDVGTGWFPPYADRLETNDIDMVIVNQYIGERAKGAPVDLQRHIEAARQCMPYLSRLADDGAVFDRCFSTTSLCAPSRASLMTGTFQNRWGAYRNVDIDAEGVPADRTVLAEPLKAVGYRCGMIGKWHIAKKDQTIKEKAWVMMGEELPIPSGYKGKWPELRKVMAQFAYDSSAEKGQHPLDRGFDYYFGFNRHGDTYYNSDTLWENHERVPKRPDGEFLTDLFNQKAAAFIKSALDAKKPFFLYYAPKTLHGQIVPPPKKYSEPFDSGVKYTDEYAGHLFALDEGIRQIYQLLEKAGQSKNTLFILTSDNGCTAYNVPPHNAPLRGGKGTGWLGGMHVPLVISGAGLPASGANSEIVSQVDLMPTILELAGADVPSGIDGKSLLPFLSGKVASGPREFLYSTGLHASHWSYFYEGNGEMNKKDGLDCPLYIWRLEGDNLLLRITKTDPGLYDSLPNGIPERTLLFDLSNDPHQWNDLHNQSPELVQRFDRGIHNWLSEMPPPMTSQQEDYDRLLELTR